MSRNGNGPNSIVRDPVQAPPAPARPTSPAREERETAVSTSAAAGFNHKWSRTQLSVRAFLTSYLSDRSVVDDCLQEVAILAWKKGPGGESQERFLAFSLACAKRIAMAEVRKKYRKGHQYLSLGQLELLAERVATQEHQDPHEPADRVSALRQCLALLDADSRSLLELRYASQDRSVLKKRAKATRSTMDAIYKKLERLRTSLRDCVTRRMGRD